MIRPFLAGVFTLYLLSSAAQQPQLMLPVGHTDKVSFVQYSPDGKYVLTASGNDFTAKIWEASSGRLLQDLKGHTDDINSALFSADGKFVVTASNDNTAKIWETAGGKLLQTLMGHTSYVESADFSADGNYVVTASLDDTAKIWEVVSGKLIQNLKGNQGVSSAQFSPNGKYLVTASWDKTGKIWDVAGGKLLHNLKGHDAKVTSAQFSPSGNYVLTASEDDRTAKIWDATSGKLLHDLKAHTDEINAARFSPDGQYVLTGSKDKTAKIWETASGKMLQNLAGHGSDVQSARFSADGKYVVTGTVGAAKIWEAAGGKMLRELSQSGWAFDAGFSPDGKYIVTTSDNTAKIWDAASGNLLRKLEGKSNGVSFARISPDGKYVVTGFSDGTAEALDAGSGKKLWDVKKRLSNIQFSPDGKSLFTLGYNEINILETAGGKLLSTAKSNDLQAFDTHFSTDGKYLVTAPYNGFTVKILETATGKLVHDLPGHTDRVLTALYSRDGRYVVTASQDRHMKIWDAVSGKLLHDKKPHTLGIRATSISPDGQRISTLGDHNARIWETSSANLVTTLWNAGGDFRSAEFSPDGQYVVTASEDKDGKIWDAASGKLLHKLEGHTGEVKMAIFTLDGKYVLTTSDDNTTKIWNTITGEVIKTIPGRLMDIGQNNFLMERNSVLSLYDFSSGNELISWVSVGARDWVVTQPSGLFDASPGAMDKLYFVQGRDIIQLDQLKDRYYEPGLWTKLMTGEKPRDVVNYKMIDLPPDVVAGVDAEGYLKIELTNRGSGIGEVTVFINGKEIVKDAREKNVNPDAPAITVKYYIGSHKNLVQGENFIGVKVWNRDHWVVSRGAVLTYTKDAGQNGYQPAVHILTCGISDYAGGADIDLTYAAKDANDVSKALQLGAAKLFGTTRSFVYNLTTVQSKETWPTKVNILKAFEKISSAHPLDVVIVYLSGHGISVGGSDGDWHYLTQNAHTVSASAYNDPAIRETTTLSSNELVELFKKVPATKQVLMIDACASGKVVDNLVAKKGVPSSTLRALDRMRDRTGMHILTGCTADAVSYEASRYGQGVLTYSILEGIRGAALRDEQFVDVNKLFQYAQDRVPVLATGIGGIQTPMVFSPNGAQSFDIGQLSEVEKKAIPISRVKPVYIQSNFQDEDELSDILGLGKKVDNLLTDAASKGSDATLIFVPVREYPDGCQLVGRYKKENGKIALKLRKKCEGQNLTFDLKGVDMNDIATQIVKIAHAK